MSFKKKASLALLCILVAGYLLPQDLLMPVQGAAKQDYHPESFWYYPWGSSVTHKGVDIFADKGTPVLSATAGIVLYTGALKKGGNVAFVLGPKWRIHYYAHMAELRSSAFDWAGRGEAIGTVGDTGNASGKAPHLHYSIYTPIPYPWRIDSDRQGWKKMFILNPIPWLQED